MAKPTTIKIRLNSTAGTGFFYVTKKNARTMTEKLVMKKYDTGRLFSFQLLCAARRRKRGGTAIPRNSVQNAAR